jgi:PAS domain S-box-containing protein
VSDSASEHDLGLAHEGDWRRPSLLPVMRLTAVVGLVRIVGGLAMAPGLIRTLSGLGDILFLVALIVACFARTAEVVRFAVIETMFFAASANVILVYGMSPGVAVLLALFVLVATISYNTRGGVAAGIVSLLLIGVGAWGWLSGHLPLGRGFPQEQPSHYEFWAHAMIAQVMSACGITWIVSYIIREMRRIIARLRLAEEKFSKSFRISPDPIVISELETGRIIDANASAERLTGYRLEEVLGRTTLELGIFKDLDDRKLFLAPLLATGSGVRIERQVRDRLGRPIDIIYSAETFELAGKRCLVTILQDVTESKRTAAALAANEERFRTFIENASVGIYRSTPAGRIIMANPALLRIMGYDSLEQLKGRNLEQEGYEPGYSRSEFKAAIEGAGIVKGLETAWKRRDGTTIFVRESANVIRGADGSIQYYDGIIEDISERKKAEQALRESEERFRNLTQAAFEGVVITENGLVLDINDQALKMLGYERAEMIGHAVADFVSPETRAIVADAISGKREVTYKHQLVRRDGAHVHVEAQARMMGLGNRTLRVTALRDITQQLQADQRQKNLEEQLRQMQKMEALGTLAGGIAHDFNNILTGILANLQLAEIDLASEHPASPSVKAAYQASVRARDLVARILSFSRLEKDNRAPASLGPVVLEAAQLLRVGLPANIEIRTEIEEECPLVVCDTGQIHQVIMNLGTNGIHSMAEGGGTLTVELRSVRPDRALLECHPQVSANHTVRLSLRDTGCGMDSAVMKRIFEPFYTTKTFGKGTGLGLAMVHATMKSHNGAIVVQSNLGAGSSFDLYFLAAVTRGAKSGADPREAKPGDLEPFGGGRRIILVDDEEPVRSIGTSILRRFGFAPVAFGRATEALDAFRPNPRYFSAVISDLTMPEMTGLELARQIQAIDPTIPIILASGYFHSDAQQEAHESGVHSVINKPFEVFELIEQVRAALGEPPAGGA